MPACLFAVLYGSIRALALCACLLVLLPCAFVWAQEPVEPAGGAASRAKAEKAKSENQVKNSSNARPAKDAPLADGTYILPVRKGDRIHAEFIYCEFGMGITEYRFLSSDNTMYDIAFGECKTESDCGIRNGEDPKRFRDLDEDKNLGKQFIIVPDKMERYIDGYDGTDIIFVKAKSVKLDTRKDAPRNTKVLPYQKISGKIMCERDEGGLSVYLTTNKGVTYDLVPYAGSAFREFWKLCDIKRITLSGEILLWVEGENAFKIRCNDTFGSECFTPDKEK